MEYESRRSK